MLAESDGQPADRAGTSAPQATADPLRRLCEADDLFRLRYEGWEELGHGTSATAAVVRTFQRDLAAFVALKIAWRLSAAERRQMRAEAQALTCVQHPAVLRTYAFFDRGALAWLEMELVDGTTLEDHLAQARPDAPHWTREHTLEIGACLAEGLAAVHAAGFLHRDVKPGNVLLPRDGPAAKLADFGVARATDATVLLSEGLAGSPRYASPEALDGQRPGAPADVYALALTLYELFSGGLNPYGLGKSATLAEMLECHRGRAPLPLRVLAPGLPPEVVDAVHAGLHKRPQRRPTAAALAPVLRQAQQRPNAAPPGAGREAVTELARILAWAMAGLLGLACGAWVLWRWAPYR